MFKQIQEGGKTSNFTVNNAQSPGRFPAINNDERLLTAFPSTLNFYFELPDIETPIERLIELAEARLSILCTISEAKTRGIRQQEVEREFDRITQQCMPLCRNHVIPRVGEKQALEQRINDAISHFILRIVYSSFSDSHAWFTSMESELFMYRMKAEDSHTRNKFFWSVFKDVPILSLEKKKEHIKELCLATGLSEFETYNIDLYIVNFQNAIHLVSHRKVYLHRGMAYVPSTEQSSLLLEAFKSYLSKSLVYLSSFNPASMGEKMKTVFEIISSKTRGISRYSLNPPHQNSFLPLNTDPSSLSTTETPSYNNINQLMKYFPPCMRNIQLILSNSGHLKYNDRLKYGLFLKWIGMSFGDSMLFWERSMYNVTLSAFKREYSYNIRYNYGLEGKRKNFPPWSCRDILSRNSPIGNHGCPFMEFPRNDLITFLQSEYSCRSSDSQRIADIAKQGSCQFACTSLLSILTDPNGGIPTISNEDSLQTPNQFYARASSKTNLK